MQRTEHKSKHEDRYIRSVENDAKFWAYQQGISDEEFRIDALAWYNQYQEDLHRKVAPPSVNKESYRRLGQNST